MLTLLPTTKKAKYTAKLAINSTNNGARKLELRKLDGGEEIQYKGVGLWGFAMQDAFFFGMVSSDRL